MKHLVDELFRIANVLDNTLIAYSIDEPAIERLKKELQTELAKLGVSAKLSPHPAHVSVAYITEPVEKNELTDIMWEGKNIGAFRGEELVFLPGLSTPYNYVALEVKAPSRFFQFQDQIEESFHTKNFKGGFKTHLSLVMGAKDELTQDVFRSLDHEVSLSFRPDKVVLFNEQHSIETAITAARKKLL
jgi:hypothetical protein